MPRLVFVVFSSRKFPRKDLEDSDCRTWMAICSRPEDPGVLGNSSVSGEVKGGWNDGGYISMKISI